MEEKMRIVQIATPWVETPPRFGGAIEKYAYGISEELRRQGNDVHLIGLRNPEAEYGKLAFHDLPVIAPPRRAKIHLPQGDFPLVNAGFVSLAVSSILKRIEESSGAIDVVHHHTLATALSPRAEKGGSSTAVLHLHNVLGLTPFNRIPLAWLLRQFRMVRAVSRYVQRLTLLQFNFLKNCLGISYNAIDPHEFERAGGTDATAVACGDPHMVYVGRLVREKGLHYVLKAMAPEGGLLPTNLHLTVVGPADAFGNARANRGEYLRFLNEEIARLDLRHRIHLLGNLARAQLIGVLRSSELVVLPSTWGEPCPTVALEAFACSRPVVAFQDGGIPELVRDGQTGMLADVGDVKGLARGIRTILDDTGLAKKLGSNARKLVEEQFTYHAVAKQLMLAYKQVVK